MTCATRFSMRATTASCAVDRNVPELVRTWLSTLLPVLLSTTEDLTMEGLACGVEGAAWLRARARAPRPQPCLLLLPAHARTSAMRWSHSSSDRKPLRRKALGDQDKCSSSPRHSSCSSPYPTVLPVLW